MTEMFCVRITGVENSVKGQTPILSRDDVLSLNLAIFQFHGFFLLAVILTTDDDGRASAIMRNAVPIFPFMLRFPG